VIVVVDTSVLIDHLRGDARATARLAELVRDGHALWSVTVVRAEVLVGMRASEERATHALLNALKWQPVTVEIADEAARLARRFRKSHSGVDLVDYLIAAATNALGARLLTRNAKHFPMLSELEPAY
jgi:predicted nucleic acid-binding protein